MAFRRLFALRNATPNKRYATPVLRIGGRNCRLRAAWSASTSSSPSSASSSERSSEGGTLALAANSARGRVYRGVLRRPLVRVLATIYVVVCGVLVALFAYDLAG